MNRVITALLSLFLLASPGTGQAGGTIRGTVKDASGAPIDGAAVEAKNSQTRMIYSAISSASGTYEVSKLPPGKYAVTVERKGMKPYSHAFLTVEAGNTIEEDVDLDVDLNPVSAEAIPAAPPPPPVSRPLLRDVYAEDAEFEITQPALIVNDRGRELAQNPGVIKGRIVWVYLPEHGRYLLSLAPLPDLGFTLAGEIGGDALKFQVDDEQVEIDSANRILMGSATYNLYVRRADWTPPQNAGQEPLIGSADRAGNLLK